MYEQSHRDYLRSGYLHHRLPVAGPLIITVITPLPTKPSATKNARELKLANAAITDMQMRQRDVAALDAKYTKELADAKAENDALRDDVAAGRRRLYIKAVCQSVREATRRSGVDNAASPRLADTAERDYFTLRERLITMQKQLKEPRSILMSSADRCPYRWATHAIIVSNTATLPAEYKCPKVSKPSNPFTNVCWVSVLTTFSAPPQILAASTVFFCPIPETKK